MKAYQAYKDSGFEFLGNIPLQWDVKRAKYVYAEIKEPSEDGSELLLSVSEYYGVKPRNEVVEEGEFVTRADSLEGYKKCQVGDLVMNIMLAWKTGLGITDFEGIVSPSYAVFRPITNVHSRYLHYLLRTHTYVSEFKRNSTGIIDSRLRLYSDDFLRVPILLPSLSEQQAIADFLDCKTKQIDTLIAKKQRQIDLLQEQRTALINHAVTKGLNPDAPMKDSGVEWLGEIHSDWSLAKVKYVCKVKGRIGFRGYTTEDQVPEGEGALTLGATHITSQGVIDLSSPVYISWEKYYESPEIMVNQKDILVVQRGSTCGKVGFIEKEIGKATINPSLVILKEHQINSKFLFYALSSKLVEYQFSPTISKTAIPMLSQEQIGNFSILLPEASEQKKIVDFLDKQQMEFDKGIDIVARQIEMLREYRTALISEAVTGKIDVR